MTRSNADTIAALAQAPVLDGDMRPRDVIEAPARLHFRHGMMVIQLDKEARDFLLDALISRYGK